ncbi:MAG: CDP-glycerol glycerophosphotransferase family protein [Fibrobacterales bacterium]
MYLSLYRTPINSGILAMRVLFYFFKNVHIPLFLPIIKELHTKSPHITLFFAAPDDNPAIREGLSPDEKKALASLPGTWLSSVNEQQCDIALMADCVADRLTGHKKVINIGHGLISKGQYYCDNPLIGRENLADVMCVPGPWHKQELEKYVYIPIEVTGMSKLDELFTLLDKPALCATLSLDPNRPIFLWAPTFNFELSGIPVLWTQIRKLTAIGQVVIKTHGTTDPFFVRELTHLAQAHTDIHFITDLDPTPLMKIADLMITDVSSVMFEFAALDKPIVLVNNPHMEEYKNYRPQDVEYTKRDIGPVITSAKELVPVVSQQLHHPEQFREKRKACTQEMFAATDGRNCARIVDVIVKHLQPTLASPTYCVIIKEAITEAQLNALRLQHPEPVTLFYRATSTSVPGITLVADTVTLMQTLAQQPVEYVLLYERACELVAPWSKQLFGQLEKKQNCPDVVGALTTQQNQGGSYFQNFMKLQQYRPPAEMTVQQVAHFLRYTNPGELHTLSTIDSPVWAVKKNTIIQNSTIIDAPSEAARYALSTDTLAVE